MHVHRVAAHFSLQHIELARIKLGYLAYSPSRPYGQFY